jgi:xanthine dehydrogenase YagS FAD-binding subunit
MRPFAYTSPDSLDAATQLLATEEASALTTKVLAGGTDLLTLMKADLLAPEQLIDIKRLPELDDQIIDDGDGVTIGALATLAELEDDPLIQARYPVLCEAAALAATPQLRNMATLGGNLLQRPRCWYFRNPRVNCWLKGGDECQAREGENQLHALFDVSPCVATHPSDPAAALLALDASVLLRGAQGERELPLTEFFAPPDDARRTETVIQPDEIITAVRIPPHPATMRSAYLKAMDRKVWAFALAGVAAAVQVERDTISQARLVLSGVAPIPWRAADAESLLIGEQPSGDLFARVAEAALAGATPLANNGYKIPLTRALIERALASVAS